MLAYILLILNMLLFMPCVDAHGCDCEHDFSQRGHDHNHQVTICRCPAKQVTIDNYDPAGILPGPCVALGFLEKSPFAGVLLSHNIFHPPRP